jgi:aspartate-semialdehyde dehydrogenase
MLKIAIVGATGLVGKMFARVLTEEKIDAEYVAFNRDGAAMVEICGKKYETQKLTAENVKRHHFDYALFSAGGDVSREFAPLFALLGTIVIDNSSAWRRDENTPLVIPECNPDEVLKIIKGRVGGFIIANPNCTTIGALVALKPLDDIYTIKRVIYNTYQAISGAGANPKFAHPIDNNVIPYIADEEEKMAFETNKILCGQRANIFTNPDIAVCATCIRVPVRNCHTISINVQFKKVVCLDEVKKVLANAPGVVLLPDGDLPMPIVANDHNEVFIGRVRVDKSCKNTLNFISASDNIRKGAATNAVQIMQLCVAIRESIARGAK